MSFSVLMSIYRKENPEYFNNAMLSIWDNQTLKPDEIILVQDGPVGKELAEVISNWESKLGTTLNVIRLDENIGLGAALNKGLEFCSFDLVVRMDTDDISLPNRFAKQVKFMRKNNDISVSSCWIEEFDTEGKKISTRKIPLEHEQLRKFIKRRSPISHAASIFRKSDILKVGGYPALRLEDYALWSLLLKKGTKFANIPEVLYQVRVDTDFFKRRGFKFLKAEFNLFSYQLDLGVINRYEYMRNCITRIVTRLSPNFVKKILYKYFRY